VEQGEWDWKHWVGKHYCRMKKLLWFWFVVMSFSAFAAPPIRRNAYTTNAVPPLSAITNSLGLTGNTSSYVNGAGQLSVPTSTAINPSDGYLPYRQSATIFGNSPLYSNFTNRLGFNATNTSLYLTTFDVGLGLNSLSVQSSAQANTALGVESLKVANGGNNNVAIGYRSLFALTTGSENNAIGLNCLVALVTGNNNTANGNSALSRTDGAKNNTALGWKAGFSNTVGEANVFIGYLSAPSAVDRTNEIVIGERAIGNGNNTATIGNSNVTGVYLTHLVGKSLVPTVSTNSGSGVSGASASISGTDLAGEVTINSGLTPVVNAAIVTITFNVAYSTAPYVVLWPSSATSSALTFLPYVTSTTTNFVINNAVSLGLAGSTTYKYNYHALQ
jgi:hypothetical protein